MITGLIIGGLVGLVASVPPAVVYSKKALENEENMLDSPNLVRASSSATDPVVTDTFRIGNAEVESTSVYRNEKQDKAMFDLIFKIINPNVSEFGIGIIEPEVTWVHANRTNKAKKVSESIIDGNVFLLKDNEEHRVKVSLEDQKNMVVSHIKMKIYEGKAGKTHSVQLKVDDYSYVDR